MMGVPDFSVKPVYFDKETRTGEQNQVTDDESKTHASTNEGPKRHKGNLPDNNDVWTGDPENKAPAKTPFLVSNILRLTNEGDNGIVTLLSLVGREGVRTYLIETVDGCRIEVPSHNLVHPEDPEISAIPLSSSDYVCKSRHISDE